MGYINYVFENLEATDALSKYIMCTQFPNWEQKTINVGDEGFVSVRYVRAGLDTWFNGQEYIPYKNTDVHFLKFVAVVRDPGEVSVVLE